ncbi:MAG: type III-B CRISPR module RAMP protein Cmr6 [Methylophilaceae bacterium]|nr:type III-B CRISPR module RAMP protein Cmr6 [Methylophilaceae bacterium]
MPIAAVPNYLGQDFKDASLGMRFGMYLKLWGINRRTRELLWTTADVDYEVRGQDQREREVKYENKVPALSDAKRLNGQDKKALQALVERQRRCFEASFSKETALCLSATAIAPFTTGLGNEHPLENGFAFLWPYGLPYLPGSGVKGVLRQAARELASGEWAATTHGWSDTKTYFLMQGEGERRKPVLNKNKKPIELSLSDVLFGRESADGETEHVRGALTFWDVIPEIKGDSLMIEIMTPHQSHYYQQKSDKKSGNSISPHDSGQPNPISFLTVPPGSNFTFHVVCDTAHLARLAPDLLETDTTSGKPRWQMLIFAAFEHAFSWLGFGAKTAGGYGAMETEAMHKVRQQKEEVRREQEKTAAAHAKAEQEAAGAVPWPGARLKFNRANKALTAEKDGKSATAIAPRGEELLATLPADIRKKVETNQFVKVTAYVFNNTLVRIEP